MVSGEQSRLHLAALIAWFVAAAYLQFRGASTRLFIAGLIGQVMLAIYLRLRLILMQVRR